MRKSGLENTFIEGGGKKRQTFSPPDAFLAWLLRKRGSYKRILPLGNISIKSGSVAKVSEIMRLPQAL